MERLASPPPMLLPLRRGRLPGLENAARIASAGIVCAALLAAPGAVSQPYKGGGLPPTDLPLAHRPERPDVIRFLEQATFGPSEPLIAHVRLVGFERYLEEQFAAPATTYPAYPAMPANQATGCPAGSAATCVRDNYTMYPLQVLFFQNALAGEDQVRQRVALALHEILVVSGGKVRQPSQMSGYLNMLSTNALGNYRTILGDLTVSPAMGMYLDMVNNDAAASPAYVRPNENYAREVLQLFSIGLNLLNPDGTDALDGQRNPIPTYTQDTIGDFARVFTGWTYPTLPNTAPARHNPPNFLGPMWLYRTSAGVDSNHDKGAKQLLAYPGAPHSALPAGQDGAVDLDQALDNIFHHPNVGPFIGRQLIQHLVTSNPSPAYVQRVTTAFENDGSGVRGNMAAVVRAILLDPEARGSVKTDPSYGRLREPVLFLTNLCRAFNASSDGILAPTATALGQNILNSATVFSYYPHEYQIPDTALQGPEFGILTAVTTESRINAVNTLAFSHINPGAPNPGTVLDLSRLTDLAGNPGALADALDGLLLHGTMSAAARVAVVDAVSAVPVTSPVFRAQTAFYLVASSSQYQVAR
jgi:uncharacterized protein (DUF1800 family)